ncbi:MAG: hypothetical protein AUG82_03710 [Ktedonobacter sp. 13_1_20CM_4_53_11]|nr:MAG: hypothetical protein AUG82_03710 [Ktedonobacter sp. 13_1_20CM_4_53_11]
MRRWIKPTALFGNGRQLSPCSTGSMGHSTDGKIQGKIAAIRSTTARHQLAQDQPLRFIQTTYRLVDRRIFKKVPGNIGYSGSGNRGFCGSNAILSF